MKRNHLELSTKCNNLSNMRQQMIQQKNLYGGKMFRNSGNQNGITSTLRSTGMSGFSQSNKFN